MKQPKRLTRDLKCVVSAYDLNPNNWMMLKDGDTFVKLINKTSKKTRIIDKFARPKKGANHGKFDD